MRRASIRFVNVEVVPTKSLERRLGRLLTKLPGQPCAELVAGTEYYPFHLTLFFTAIEQQQLGEVVRRVSGAVDNHEGVHILLKGWRVYRDGSLAIAARRSKALLALHTEIATCLGRLERRPSSCRLVAGFFSEEELHHYKECGDPYALDRYSPHITIARYPSAGQARLARRGLPSVAERHEFTEVRVRTWATEYEQSILQGVFHLAKGERDRV